MLCQCTLNWLAGSCHDEESEKLATAAKTVLLRRLEHNCKETFGDLVDRAPEIPVKDTAALSRAC